MAVQPKQKPLLPVLKEKKRYYAYRIHAENEPPARAGPLLIKELQRLLGVIEAARAGLLHITYDEHKKTGVLKTSNEQASKVRQALLLVQQLGKETVMVQPILASGILRKAKQAM